VSAAGTWTPVVVDDSTTRAPLAGAAPVSVTFAVVVWHDPITVRPAPSG
jgi:hypothetical protein